MIINIDRHRWRRHHQSEWGTGEKWKQLGGCVRVFGNKAERIKFFHTQTKLRPNQYRVTN